MTDQILQIMVLLKTYEDGDELGIEVDTVPTKNEEVVKGLSNTNFVNAVVISNAIEIVAHNSEAAIEVVHKYGDAEVKRLMTTHAHTIDSLVIGGNDNDLQN